jgi:hypothetical protein
LAIRNGSVRECSYAACRVLSCPLFGCSARPLKADVACHADFGLAVNRKRERPVTRLGTLDYMAPEARALENSCCVLCED